MSHDHNDHDGGQAKFKLSHEIRRYLNVHRGLHEIAEKLEHVSDLEAAGAEAANRLASLTAQVAAAHADLEKTKAEVSDARQQAAGIVQAAHEDAGRITAGRRAEHEEHAKRLQERIEAKQQQLRDVEHQTRAAVEAHNSALAKVTEANNEHDRVLGMVAALKAKF